MVRAGLVTIYGTKQELLDQNPPSPLSVINQQLTMKSEAYFTNISPQEFLQLSSPFQRGVGGDFPLNNQLLLIDVRSNLEYITGHAPTAINLSLPRILLGNIPILRKWVLPEWFLNLPKDEPIAVICLSAHRSPIVAKELVKAGFTQVFNITGGMLEWRRLNLETFRGKSQPV